MAENEQVVNTAAPTTAEATIPSVPEKEMPEVPEKPEPEKEQFIPKSRFDEVNDERNQLREQNRLLIEMQSKGNKPPAPEPETEYLDPAVKALADKNKRLEMALGGMANKLDLMEAQNNPEFKDYKKYAAEVERVHRDMLNGGQFVSRSLIYTHLKGQEALKGGGRQSAATTPTETPETPEAIPQTKPAAKSPAKSNKPETLEEKVARLSKVEF